MKFTFTKTQCAKFARAEQGLIVAAGWWRPCSDRELARRSGEKPRTYFRNVYQNGPGRALIKGRSLNVTRQAATAIACRARRSRFALSPIGVDLVWCSPGKPDVTIFFIPKR